jgi:DNA-directed RNA polymerase alpha subunit
MSTDNKQHEFIDLSTINHVPIKIMWPGQTDGYYVRRGYPYRNYEEIVRIFQNTAVHPPVPKSISLTAGITDLRLSTRTTNILDAAGIRTISDLVVKKEDDLMELRLFGEVARYEVLKKLAEHGLRLGMKPAEINQVRIEDV